MSCFCCLKRASGWVSCHIAGVLKMMIITQIAWSTHTLGLWRGGTMAVYKVSCRSGSISFYLWLPWDLFRFLCSSQAICSIIDSTSLHKVLIQMFSVAAIVMSTAVEFRCKCCESVNLTGGWGILDMHQCSWWAVMELADSKCGEAAAAVYLLR